MNFANFFEGVGTAAVLFIAAEITFNYSVGDKVKDLFLKLIGKYKPDSKS